MRERDIFAAALERTDPAARAAFLDEACGGDPGLRAHIERLLRAHDQPDSLLDVPPDAPDATAGRPADLGGDTTSTLGGPGGATEGDLGFLGPPGRPDSLGRIGHYDVLEVLGRGGFGIVFRAFDGVLQRVVAVKVLSPLLAVTSPARKRFLREARSAAAVRHENVVRVYAVEEQPLPYLVMEFIPGETLQARLSRTGPFGAAEVVRIGRQIAEGLAAAHEQGLVHRDVKPANVLVEAGSPERAKLTDFGLARAADDASLSQSGVVAGTPMYMSPEQALGESLDHRTDLFSLGSVLYAITSGRPPFRADGAVAVLKRVAEDTPRPIREIIPETPDWLCRVIQKLHAKDPAERFQTAREVADLLADCERQLAAHDGLMDLSRIPAGKQASKKRWRWVAVAVVALAVLLGAVIVAAQYDWFAARTTARNDPSPPGPTDHEPKDSNRKWMEAFTKYVATLPPHEQVGAVEAELRKRTVIPGGAVGSRIDGGKVVMLNLSELRGVIDLSPVAALPHLDAIYLPGGSFDLEPLRGLRLTYLDCVSDHRITDLSPLRGMPLKYLRIWQWTGDDITPLRGMPLQELNVGGGGGKVDMTVLKGMPLEKLYLMHTDVSDLSALAGMRLTDLGLSGSRVTDLTQLRGMPLRALTIDDTAVADLRPLAGMALDHLQISKTKVTDLSPLKGMPLTIFHCKGAAATDLRPLAGAPVKNLEWDVVPGRDAEILRGVKTLETINGQPAAEFWKQAGKE